MKQQICAFRTLLVRQGRLEKKDSWMCGYTVWAKCGCYMSSVKGKVLQDKLLEEIGWPHSAGSALACHTCLCTWWPVRLSYAGKCCHQGQTRSSFRVCSCLSWSNVKPIASGFKAWAGPVKMKELKKTITNEVIPVIENLQIKEILVRDLEFSRKCKRKRNPEILKFPEPHGQLSWTLFSLLGHQWGYSADLCPNCLSNDLLAWESIKGALEKEAQGSLSFPWAFPHEPSGWRRKNPILHSNYIPCDNHALK